MEIYNSERKTVGFKKEYMLSISLKMVRSHFPPCLLVLAAWSGFPCESIIKNWDQESNQKYWLQFPRCHYHQLTFPTLQFHFFCERHTLLCQVEETEAKYFSHKNYICAYIHMYMKSKVIHVCLYLFSYFCRPVD